MSDKNHNLIMNKLMEISDRTSRIEEGLKNVKEDVTKIEAQDKIQNELLAEHIAGTVTNRERLDLEIKNRKDLESRVESLETVPNFMKSFKKLFIGIGALASASYGIFKWFQK